MTPPSTEPQDHGQLTAVRRRRQNPISCRFCREKKLKCDRRSVCSNCSFRGLSCSNESKSYFSNEFTSSDHSHHAELLERLKRLEEIVLNQQRHSTSCGDRPQAGHTDARIETAGSKQSHAVLIASGPLDASEGRKIVDFGETPASEYTEAVQSLETTGLRSEPWLRIHAVNTEVTIATVPHIAELLNSNAGSRDSQYEKPTASCALPSKEEAIFLLNYYRDHLEDLQHILHIPTVQEHLETCYTGLANGERVNVRVLVLLLSIFASASTLISHYPEEKAQPFTGSTGTRLSAYWANFALAILKDHQNTPCDMVEEIQAAALLGSLLVNVEGFSARVHLFFVVIISKARDLSLHKIDAVGSRTPWDAIDTEVKRRVWWYIVAIDWVLSASGGPQEGTYSVQPRQMAVDIPRNLDDRDLIYTNPSIRRDISEPTTMSYYIQRIRLSDLCREITDLLPISMSDASTVEYQHVIALDQRFHAFLEELPVFLRNDRQSIRQSGHIVARYPQMRVQRQLLSMLARTKRCKLHQPFLIRGSIDKRYSYSRNMSLQSARAVLEEKRRNDVLEMNGHPEDRYMLSGYITYYTFMATIVLVMDVCFNNKASAHDGNNNENPNHTKGSDVSDDNETKVTKTEVMEACRSLTRDQSPSGLGGNYLTSLMDVLRKYNVQLRPLGAEDFSNNTGTSNNIINRTSQQTPSLLPQMPPYSSANVNITLTQVPSTPGTSSLLPQPPVLTENTNPPNAGTDPFANINLNFGSYSNELAFSGHGPAESVGSADTQRRLADFDDIWKDLVELGTNLDMPHWDNLFTDLGPGMA